MIIIIIEIIIIITVIIIIIRRRRRRRRKTMLIGIKCFHDFLPLFTEVCLQVTQITTGNNELLILLTSISINALESFWIPFLFRLSFTSPLYLPTYGLTTTKHLEIPPPSSRGFSWRLDKTIYPLCTPCPHRGCD